MPRKSINSYLPAHLRPKPTGKRVLPPKDLGPRECEIFNGIVASLPADWFHECNKLLLAQYAEHVVMRSNLKSIAEDALKRGDLLTYRSIILQLERGSKLMLAFLRSMRLAQKSTMQRETTKHTDVSVTAEITKAA